MTRQKKSRKPGSIGKKKITAKEESTSKKAKKSKGLSAGSRNNQEKSNTKQGISTKGSKDKRLGSKVAIPLIVEEPKPIKQPKAKISNPIIQLTPEKELEQLENDSKLADLMDKAEANERLTSAEQLYLDKKLSRYHQLCDELGLDMDTEEDDDSWQADSGEEWRDLLDEGDH